MKTRLLGLALIVAGASAASWLYRLVHDLPYREEGVEHMAIALLAFLALTTGAALLVFGSALFKIQTPPRH